MPDPSQPRGVDAAAVVDELDDRFRMAGAPDRAENERRYLRSELTHRGVGVPEMRRLTRQVLRARPTMGRDDLLGLVDELWSRQVHELRMAAVEALIDRSDLLDPDDLDIVEGFLRDARTWALVDTLAAKVAGPLLDRRPDRRAVLDRWIADDDFWIRRSALLTYLHSLRAGTASFDEFGGDADRLLGEREFFIRKAIGWVLREVARRHPEVVHAWLLPRAARASGVTVREAVKPLDETQRAAIAAARS